MSANRIGSPQTPQISQAQTTQQAPQAPGSSIGGTIARIALGIGRVALGIATLGISEAVIRGIQSYAARQIDGPGRVMVAQGLQTPPVDAKISTEKSGEKTTASNNRLRDDFLRRDDPMHDYTATVMWGEKNKFGITDTLSSLPPQTAKQFRDNVAATVNHFIDEANTSGRELSHGEVMEVMRKSVDTQLQILKATRNNGPISEKVLNPSAMGSDLVDTYVSEEHDRFGISETLSGLPKEKSESIRTAVKKAVEGYVSGASNTGVMLTEKDVLTVMRQTVRNELQGMKYKLAGLSENAIPRTSGQKVEFSPTDLSGLGDRFAMFMQGGLKERFLEPEDVEAFKSEKVPESLLAKRIGDAPIPKDPKLHEMLVHLDPQFIKDVTRANYVIDGKTMTKSDPITTIRAFAEMFRGVDGNIDFKSMHSISSILCQSGDAAVVTDPALLSKGLVHQDSTACYHRYELAKGTTSGQFNVTIRTQSVPAMSASGVSSYGKLGDTDAHSDYTTHFTVVAPEQPELPYTVNVHDAEYAYNG